MKKSFNSAFVYIFLKVRWFLAKKVERLGIFRCKGWNSILKFLKTEVMSTPVDYHPTLPLHTCSYIFNIGVSFICLGVAKNTSVHSRTGSINNNSFYRHTLIVSYWWTVQPFWHLLIFTHIHKSLYFIIDHNHFQKSYMSQ